MEFFERAHVVKKKPEITPKVDENIKNQLKQMLRGYKENDKKMIKDAEKALLSTVNDSDSVSGFSDLNLTSSSEGDSPLDADVTESNGENDDEVSSQASENKDESENKSSNDSESISEYEDDNESLPDETQGNSQVDDPDISQMDAPGDSQEDVLDDSEKHDSENSQKDASDTSEEDDSDNSEIKASDNSQVEDSDNDNLEENDSDEQFDPDGTLACKILQRINAKKNIKAKKRKVNEPETDESSEQEEVTFTGSIMRQTRDFNRKCRKEKEREQPHQLPDDNDEDCDQKFDASTQDSTSTGSSAPYISVTATDMPEQTLCDVLGEYKYPTMKNMPCEHQSQMYATAKSEIFTPEPVETANIMMEEDTDSLMPELGDMHTDQDLLEDLNEILIENNISIDDSVMVQDSVESDDSTQIIITDEQASTVSTEQEIINPVRTVFYGKNTCILVLKHPTKIYIHGKVKAKALGGTIEVFGHTLQDRFSEIYAPNYNFAQSIKTVACENVYYGLFNKLTSSGLSVQDAEEIVTTIGDYDGVLCLSALNNRRMDFVENNFTAADLFTKPSKYIEICFKKASELLGCSLYLTPPSRSFVENNVWEQAVTCGLDPKSRAVVCGGKGTGKSTFLRYYINKLVANGPILLIDLDPGQAELTVAGNVSATLVSKPLIGPNFTHLTKPDKMLNIGMISTMDNPTRYASAVLNILEYCYANVNYKKVPWIVNTMGMCNNLGLKFLTLIIQLVQSTILVKMDSTNLKKRFEIDLQPSSVQQFYNTNKYDRLFRNIPLVKKLEYTLIISSPVEMSSKVEISLSAKEERYLNFLAYFGGLLDTHSGPGILGIVPYEVKLEDLNVGSNVNIRKDAVTKVINGKIIALCQLTTPDKGRVFNLSDNAVLCLGHGLVRGVDFDKGLLYIITPAPIETLVHVNTLLYSDWVPDLKGQDKQVPDGTIIPYRTTSKQKQLMSTPHRRFNPLQLLKMSRKS